MAILGRDSIFQVDIRVVTTRPGGFSRPFKTTEKLLNGIRLRLTVITVNDRSERQKERERARARVLGVVLRTLNKHILNKYS